MGVTTGSPEAVAGSARITVFARVVPVVQGKHSTTVLAVACDLYPESKEPHHNK